MTMQRMPWEMDSGLMMAEANLRACAYNAAVNHGTARGLWKMGDLIRAINYHEREEGRAKLDFLVQSKVIDSYTACPAGCEMRPGGLFHADGCENDCNHPVYRSRIDAAQAALPSAQANAAHVSLVGAA